MTKSQSAAAITAVIEKPALGFWRKLFATHNTITRPVETEYTDIRSAVHALLEYSGLRREQLAAKIGIMPHTVKLMEMTGGVMSQTHCERCSRIANDYALPVLARFFDSEGMRNARKKRTRKSQKDSDGPDHWAE